MLLIQKCVEHIPIIYQLKISPEKSSEYNHAGFFSGYYGDGLNAIVVFAVCFMPESGQPNYRYLMDNLFRNA